MTRVRFDPEFFRDDRWPGLGIDAFTLHAYACAHVVDVKSNGFVSTWQVGALTPLVRNPKRTASRLVEAGMWQLADGGFLVCKCVDDLRKAGGRGDEQPSRQFIEEERKRADKRKADWRARNAQKNKDGNGVPIRDQNDSQSSAEQFSAGERLVPPALPPLCELHPHAKRRGKGGECADCWSEAHADMPTAVGG